jgi:hypothetical protein
MARLQLKEITRELADPRIVKHRGRYPLAP